MGAPGEGPAVGVTGPGGPAVEGTPSCGDIGVNGDMGRCMANELTYDNPSTSTNACMRAKWGRVFILNP